MRTLFLLSYWQLANTIRELVKKPRRLLPLLFFGAMILLPRMIFWIGRPMTGPLYQPPTRAGFSMSLPYLHPIIFFCSILLGAATFVRGLTGGNLEFLPADMDYLFPSALSRRLVLLWKLPTLYLVMFFRLLALSLFVWATFTVQLQLTAGVSASSSPLDIFWPAFLCFSFVVNISIIAELVLGSARFQILVKAIEVGLLGIIGVLLYQGIRHGLDLAVHFADNPLLTTVCYPFKLCADAIADAINGAGSLSQQLQLGGLVLISAAILLNRRENYYEEAAIAAIRVGQIRQAMKSGDLGLAHAIQSEGKRRRLPAGRLYSIPPFGHGAGSLFWAHLAAAAKRPFVNFLAPLFLGGAVAFAAYMVTPTSGALVIAVATAYYLVYIPMFTGALKYQQGHKLNPLVRPLPLKGGQVVIADLAPKVLIQSLPVVPEIFALPFFPDRHALLVAGLLVTCTGSLSFSLNALPYMLSLLYPGTQDKMQRMIIGLLQTLGMAIIAVIVGVFFAVPLFVGAPDWVTVISVTLACLAIAAILFILSIHAYRGFQPTDEL